MTSWTVRIEFISSPWTPLVSSARLPGRAPFSTATETCQGWPVTPSTPWK